MNPSKPISTPKKGDLKRKRNSTPPKVKEIINGLGLDSSRSFSNSKSNNNSNSNASNHSNINNESNTNNHSNCNNHSKCPSESYMDSLHLSPEAKNTKKRKNYKFVKTFESINDIDAYVRTVSKNGYKIDKNNGLVNCSICELNFDDGDDKHKMEQQYWKCLCGVPSCDLAWKVNKCSNEATWYFAQSGELHPQDWVVVRAPGQKPKKRFGIAKNVMVLYTEFLKKCETMSATDMR
jgi:hypothetical protein